MPKRIPTADETAILVEARTAIAAGNASLDLIERAYRVVERYDYDPADESILAAAVDHGVMQEFFLEREANGIDGWSRIELVHIDGRIEPLDILQYRQANPNRIVFDIDIEHAAGRIAKALPVGDPRRLEIDTLAAARVAVRKSLNRQVSKPWIKITDDIASVIHALESGWDDHHRLQLVSLAGTPVTVAPPKPFSREKALVEALVGPHEENPQYTWLSAVIGDLEDRLRTDPAFREMYEGEDPLSASEAMRESRTILTGIEAALELPA